MNRAPDDVNRLFYVGATRTKEHLHIVEPKDIYKELFIMSDTYKKQIGGSHYAIHENSTFRIY
jgi:superfamily I DNA/RNA helicase